MQISEDNPYIVSNQTIDEVKTVVIKQYFVGQNDSAEVKLSHIFEFLPSGIVHKDATGMGATTLELRALRNSIVVEPLKVTASHKAYLEKAFYVGSPTVLHPKKVTDDQIKNYCIEAEGYVKFVVVADSLPRLRDALGQSFDKFFYCWMNRIVSN